MRCRLAAMKSINDYTVVVAPDDDAWFAYVPAIPGCHAMGETAEEARRELEGVFEMFRDDYLESGEGLPPDVKELVAVAS